MKITLKNLKVAANLSEETTAYTAIICIDGQPAFHASNHGHGGCDLYDRVAGYTGPTEREVSEWLAANLPPLTGHGMTLPMDLELFVCDLITAEQRRKRLDRMVKAKIVLIGQHKGADALFTIKMAPTPANLAVIAAKSAGKVVVNGDAAAYSRALALV